MIVIFKDSSRENPQSRNFCKVHSRHYSLTGLTELVPIEFTNDQTNTETEFKHLYAKKKTKRYCDTAPRRLYNVEVGDEFEVYKPYRRSAIQFDVDSSAYSNL